MKKIFILLFLSFLIVGCSSSKQTNVTEEVHNETIKEEIIEETKDVSTSIDSVDIYLDENCLSYKEITFNQDYIYENIGRNFELKEENSIEGIEICGIYESDVQNLDKIKNGSTVNIYFPSEINGKQVLSIVGLFPYFTKTTNVTADSLMTYLNIPNSTLLLKDVDIYSGYGLIHVNDNLQYVSGCGNIDKIVDSMKYFSGSAFLKQETFNIDGSLILDGCNIGGEINTVNIDSFSQKKNGRLYIGTNSVYSSLDNITYSNIGCVNINCDMLYEENNYFMLDIVSEQLYVADNVSFGGYISYLLNYYYDQFENGATIELGKNVKAAGKLGNEIIGKIDCNDGVMKYIINDPSNADVLSGHLDKDVVVINKSGQEVDWHKIFPRANPNAVFVSGRLEFYNPELTYIDVIEG